MDDLAAFFGIALGVAVSVVYPVVKGYVQQQYGPTAAKELPPWVKKYAALAAFSMLTAFIVLAVVKTATPEREIGFWVAALLGIGWESTVEKAIRPGI